MNEGKRSRLSPTQRTEIWSRWKSGQSLHEIGRAFGKPHSSIRCLLLPRGGIPPGASRSRCRAAAGHLQSTAQKNGFTRKDLQVYTCAFLGVPNGSWLD